MARSQALLRAGSERFWAGRVTLAQERTFDLLQAAWGLTDREFEQLLQVPAGWLAGVRIYEVHPLMEHGARLERLLKFHDAIRLVSYQSPPDYAAWWRREWRKDSPIGAKSPLSAVLELGDPAIDELEQIFKAQV